jgi:hypothetical protein
MPSWTCGGYASPNLAAAKAYYFEPRKKVDEILLDVAGRRYGKAAAPSFIEAWRRSVLPLKSFHTVSPST